MTVLRTENGEFLLCYRVDCRLCCAGVFAAFVTGCLVHWRRRWGGRGLKEDVSRERLCGRAGMRCVWCVCVENGRVYVVVFV